MQSASLISPARPAAGEFAPYYGKYIERVAEGDIAATLEQNARDTAALLRLADAERVFAYRMMRFGRADTTELPGFDENAYVPAGEFDARTLNDLVDEFLAVRGATIALIRGLPASAWTRQGIASNNPMSARALAWVIAGHELHHRTILEERYLA